MHVPGSTCRFSAWYSANGELVGAEKIDRRGRSIRPVPYDLYWLAREFDYVKKQARAEV
jgi:hypothetical protein